MQTDDGSSKLVKLHKHVELKFSPKTWDCRRKLEYPDRTHAARGEHENTTQKDPSQVVKSNSGLSCSEATVPPSQLKPFFKPISVLLVFTF